MARVLDIAGQSVSVPDPDSVQSLSSQFAGVSQQIAEAATKLRAVGSPQESGVWTGQSADLFAANLGQLPAQLETAENSYNAAALALSDYASELRPVIARLTALVTQGEEAESTSYALARALGTARSQHQDAATIASLTTRLHESQSQITQIGRTAEVLDAELKSLSASCVRQLRAACGEDIKDTSLVDRIAHDAGSVLKDAWGAASTVVEDIVVAPLIALPKDAVAVVEDPGNFQAWSHLFGDAAGVIGVAALLLPGVGEIAAPVLLGLAAASTATETDAVLTHEGGATWEDVGIDAAGFALGGAGDVTDAAGDAATDDSSFIDALKAGGNQPVGAGVREGVDEFSEDLNTPVTQAAFMKIAVDDITPFVNFGTDGTADAPAAAVAMQRISFGIGLAGDALTVATAPPNQGSQ